MLTADRLRELLDYDPETGVVTWRIRTSNRISVGSIAGCFKGAPPHKYRVIRIDGTLYRACRLVWLYTHGIWPELEIDHRNRDTTDDRLDNLREATSLQNKANRSICTRNNSGYRGVFWHKKNQNWCAQIRRNGKSSHIGSFDNEVDAARAYDAEARLVFGDFASVNFV